MAHQPSDEAWNGGDSGVRGQMGHAIMVVVRGIEYLDRDPLPVGRHRLMDGVQQEGASCFHLLGGYGRKVDAFRAWDDGVGFAVAHIGACADDKRCVDGR